MTTKDEKKPVIQPNEYQCCACGGIFEKGWSDEEARAEQGRNFQEAPTDDDAILCDDCYKKLMSQTFN